MASRDLVRTTIRLPRSLHLALKEHAGRVNSTLEHLIERAVRRELAEEDKSLSSDSLDLYDSVRGVLDAFRNNHRNPGLAPIDPVRSEPFAWSPMLAYRFLQAMPALAIIKDHNARIIWCNAACEAAFKRPLAEVRNKPITDPDLGFVDAQNKKMIETDIKHVLDTQSEMESIETVNLPKEEGTGETEQHVLRVLRFVFKKHGSDAESYLGDISFDFQRSLARSPASVSTEAVDSWSRPSQAPKEILGLLQPFLVACPTSAAIKDQERRLVWCNRVFLHLAGAASVNDVKGQTAEEIFGLDPFDELVRHEIDAMASKTAAYAREQLPDWGPRTTIRFPILFGNGRVQLLGTLSANFGLSYEYRSQQYVAQPGLESGENGNEELP